MSTASWGVIVAIVAVFVGGWFSWRSLRILSFNQTDTAMLSMKAQLADTWATLATDLQSIAHTIRMTRSAPYTFTSVVKRFDADGNVSDTDEYPGSLWITFEGGDSASIETKRVTLSVFSQAHDRALSASLKVEFAVAQYRALVVRSGGRPMEILSSHRNVLARLAAALERLLEGSLHWTPSEKDIAILGDAGIGVPDNALAEMLAAFEIQVPPHIASAEIEDRHRWARQMVIERLSDLSSDGLRQIVDALALTQR
ncbi:MAG: hypothetical protein M0008_12880 [Actinomycetota bacterium]|nr:hypothetical protein [Actinomycetota bacterium]